MNTYKVTVVTDRGFYSPERQFMLIFLRSNYCQSIPSDPELGTRSITIRGKSCLVIGQEHYEDRHMNDKNDREGDMKDLTTDTFIVLFSVNSREAFNNVKKKWIPKIRSYYPSKPIIIAATLIECRTKDPSADNVSSVEVYNMAKEMGTSYWETSLDRNQGVTDCFIHAVELAMWNKKRSKPKSMILNVMRKSSAIIPPLRPPPDPEPVIQVSPSTFVDDWLQALADPKFHDVRFIVEGGRHFLAHKAILCSASSYFKRIFLPSSSSDTDETSDNSSKVQNVDRIGTGPDGKETVVELSCKIQAKTFVKMLQKIYTGGYCEGEEDTNTAEKAEVFDLSKLMSCCQESSNEQDGHGDKKSPGVSDKTAKVMRELFNGADFSDFTIVVNVIPQNAVLRLVLSQNTGDSRAPKPDVFQPTTKERIKSSRQAGTKIPVHKVVICARSPALSPLVEGESHTQIPIPDTNEDSLKFFLEYLYTDQVQFNDSSNVIDVLSLAHRYGADRLVTLCEQQLKAELEKICYTELYMKDVELLNAIQLLISYQACNALQMVDWCRHYMSLNYSKFCDREEFLYLDWKEREYIKEHRWPPLSFMDDMEEFEQQFPL